MNPDAQNYHLGAAYLIFRGVDLGGTMENGVTIIVERDVFMHKSGKYGSTPVRATLIGMKVEIEAELGETTAENLEKVLQGGMVNKKLNAVAGTDIQGGILKVIPFDGTEAWIFTNAISTGPIEVAYQPNKPRLFKVKFTAMIDSNAAAGEELGYLS